MSYIVENSTTLVSTSTDGTDGHTLPTLTGVQEGDLLIMAWGASDDNRVTLDDSGWTELAGATSRQNSCEVVVKYKFATADDEQFSSFSASSAGILIYMYGYVIRGADLTTPFADAQTSQYTSSANTIVRYPALTATADNQLVLYLANSDADNITLPTEASVRLIAKYPDSNMYQKVVNAGVVPFFDGSVDSDQTDTMGLIINDKTGGNQLQPLEIHPIKALTNINPDNHNDGGWREAIYASGKSLDTGATRIDHTPTFGVYGTTAQWVFKIDNASSFLTGTVPGETINFGNGDTANFARYDQYQPNGGGRGYIVVYNYSGTAVPDNSSVLGATSGNTALIQGTGVSFQADVTNYIRFDSILPNYKLVKSYNIGGIADGTIAFIRKHTTMLSDIEGWWYKLVSDSPEFRLGTDLIPSVSSGTASLREYGMCTTDYTTTGAFDYPPTPSGGVLGWLTNITGNCRSYTTPKNMSGKKLAIWTRARNSANTKNIYVLIIDSANEWKMWRVWRRYGQLTVPEFTLIDPASNDTPFSQSGAFNPASVKYYGIIGQCSTDSTHHLVYTYQQYFLEKQSVTGGGLDKPVSWKDIDTMLNSEETEYGTIFNESLQTIVPSQYMLMQELSLGDGLKFSHFEMKNQALSFPPQADGNTNFLFNVDKNAMGIETHNVSGNINNSIIASDKGATFTSVAGDTIDYAGTLFISTTSTLQSGKTYTNASWIDSDILDLNGASLLGCVVSGATNATGGVLLDITESSTINGSTIKDCSTYGLRIDGVGNLTLDDVTFSENGTKDINVTATTGVVNITITGGGTTPTFDTAGATVNIIVPSLTATVTPIIAGSRIRVYNETTGTEIVNVIEPTTTWSLGYDEGTEFTAGDIVSIYITKLGYLSQTITAIAAASSWTVPAEQKVDTIYDTNGIDGATVTEFSADFPNVQIDINDGDGSTTAQRLYAWWSNVLTTEDGIRYWLDGMFAEDSNNYRVVTSIIDIHLQNTSATPVWMHGARLYRDDNTTILDAGTGPIQLDPLRAYIAPEVTNMSVFLSFNGAVWLDVDNGIDDDTDPLNGTQKTPCKTLSRAIEIASGMGFSTFQLSGELVLDQPVSTYEFISWKNGKIDLNNQACLATRFRELKVYGEQNSIAMFYDCRITNLQGLAGVYERCRFLDTTTMEVSGNTVFMNECTSGVAGGDSPVFDCAVGGIDLSIRNYSGGIKLLNYDNASNEATIEFLAGKLNLDSTSDTGTIHARGVYALDKNGATCEVLEGGRAMPADTAVLDTGTFLALK